MMDEILEKLLEIWLGLKEYFGEQTGAVIMSALLIVIALIFHLVFTRLILRPWKRRLSPQAMHILRKGVRYGLTVIVFLLILQQFGVKLGALLGAAGIAGIAIGFAAQTSLSNIISGVFLLWERPFEIGDVIRVNDQTGIVESIDLLSLTLRTLDNLLVRIPNESLVNGQLTNITRHPIRRYDFNIGTSYKSDPDHVMEVLRTVAKDNHLVLEEPAPLIAFTGFGESSLDFMVGVWHEKNDYIELRNTVLRDLKKAFEKENIEIPYPHRVIVSGDGIAKGDDCSTMES